jgi:hypothetical protein
LHGVVTVATGAGSLAAVAACGLAAARLRAIGASVVASCCAISASTLLLTLRSQKVKAVADADRSTEAAMLHSSLLR